MKREKIDKMSDEVKDSNPYRYLLNNSAVLWHYKKWVLLKITKKLELIL